jgi:hypothetical protein
VRPRGRRCAARRRERIAGLEADRREDILRRHRDAGIDQHARQPRQRHRRHLLAGAAHHAARRQQAHRHVGARSLGGSDHTRIVGRKGVGAREQPQRRCGVGRAATDASRRRQMLVEHEGAGCELRHALAQQPRSLGDKIVGEIAAVGGAGSGHGERKVSCR